jgi:hypothetical protein
MKNFCFALLAVYAMFFQGFCTKAQSTYVGMVKESDKIQLYGRNILRANLEAYSEGSLSVETLGELNPLTGAFVDKMSQYRKALKAARQFVTADGTLPANRLAAVEQIFNEAVAAFEVAVTTFGLKKVLTPKLQQYIDLVRAAIAASRVLFSDARDLLNREASYAAA